MFGGAPGVGHDGEGNVLIGIAIEGRGVRDEEIFHFMGLRPLIEDPLDLGSAPMRTVPAS